MRQGRPAPESARKMRVPQQSQVMVKQSLLIGF